jgi:integrase
VNQSLEAFLLPRYDPFGGSSERIAEDGCPHSWGQLWGALGSVNMQLPQAAFSQLWSRSNCMLNILTDTKIRAATPCGKTQRLFDGGGLYLELSPKGGRWWRMKYRFAGKENRLSLGVYPDVSLKLARERAGDVRSQLANGVDPSAARVAVKEAQERGANADSFESLTREWYRTVYQTGVSTGQATRTLNRLESDVLPWLGKTPISALTAPEILKVLRRVEARGAIETAHRELQSIGQICRYAVATGRAKADPTRDLRGALKPFHTLHMASITEPERVGALLRAIDDYEGTFSVKCALRLAPLVFVRPGELRAAQWQEFDLENGLWRIPAARMKGTLAAKASGRDHIVPLSTQAKAVLEDLKPLTGHLPHLFPSTRGRGRVMSDVTLIAALRRLGFSGEEMTVHGFRAMARTMLVERLDWDESIIEAQLAHRVRDALGRAYNRTQFVEQRVKMMQCWADYLDQLRSKASRTRIVGDSD